MPKTILLENSALPTDGLLFKHSTACPISHRAAEEIRSLPEELTVYWVNVIEQRPISNSIAEAFKIRHESPQLLWLQQGQVTQVWNHSAIQARTILQTVTKA